MLGGTLDDSLGEAYDKVPPFRTLHLQGVVSYERGTPVRCAEGSRCLGFRA